MIQVPLTLVVKAFQFAHYIMYWLCSFQILWGACSLFGVGMTNSRAVDICNHSIFCKIMRNMFLAWSWNDQQRQWLTFVTTAFFAITFAYRRNILEFFVHNSYRYTCTLNTHTYHQSFVCYWSSQNQFPELDCSTHVFENLGGISHLDRWPTLLKLSPVRDTISCH